MKDTLRIRVVNYRSGYRYITYKMYDCIYEYNSETVRSKVRRVRDCHILKAKCLTIMDYIKNYIANETTLIYQDLIHVQDNIPSSLKKT